MQIPCPGPCFRSFLGLWAGSRFESQHSSRLIEIDYCYEKIDKGDFEDERSLSEVVFTRQTRLKAIDCFGGCTSLPRIEIPLSLEVIEESGSGDAHR
jgi:hypothetical protein